MNDPVLKSVDPGLVMPFLAIWGNQMREQQELARTLINRATAGKPYREAMESLCGQISGAGYLEVDKRSEDIEASILSENGVLHFSMNKKTLQAFDVEPIVPSVYSERWGKWGSAFILGL